MSGAAGGDDVESLAAWRAKREEAVPEMVGEPAITFGWDEGSPVTFRDQGVLAEYVNDAIHEVLRQAAGGDDAEAPPTRVVGRNARLSDGTMWPLPDIAEGGLAWTLTYGQPTREQALRAASIVRAYGYLLTETNAPRRAQVVRDIRAALAASVSEGR